MNQYDWFLKRTGGGQSIETCCRFVKTERCTSYMHIKRNCEALIITCFRMFFPQDFCLICLGCVLFILFCIFPGHLVGALIISLWAFFSSKQKLKILKVNLFPVFSSIKNILWMKIISQNTLFEWCVCCSVKLLQTASKKAVVEISRRNTSWRA